MVCVQKWYVYKNRVGPKNGVIVLFRVITGLTYLCMGFSSSLTSIFILRMIAMAAETIGYCIFTFVFAVEIVGPKYTK